MPERFSIQRTLIPYLATALCVLAFASCEKSGQDLSSLSFETTSRISTENRIALVTDPYISFRDKSGADGITVAHGRRGEIYDISGVSLIEADGELITWYNLGPGWVVSTSVQIYSDRSKAESASKSLY